MADTRKLSENQKLGLHNPHAASNLTSGFLNQARANAELRAQLEAETTWVREP